MAEGRERCWVGSGSVHAGSEEVPSEFTLRRSCAQTLDHIAVELRGALLPHVLPIVERYLADEDWRLREAAILALGAIADGCAESLRARVPGILRLLLDKMADPQPNVRCNSCWAAGRYTAFRVQDAAEEGDRNAEAEVFHIVKALLERAQVRPASARVPEPSGAVEVALSWSRAVQEHNVCVHYAALSALSCVHEDLKHYQAGAMLESSAPDTLRTLVALLPHYTKRNVRQAFETLIQIVRAVPVCMEDPDIIKVRVSGACRCAGRACGGWTTDFCSPCVCGVCGRLRVCSAAAEIFFGGSCACVQQRTRSCWGLGEYPRSRCADVHGAASGAAGVIAATERGGDAAAGHVDPPRARARRQRRPVRAPAAPALTRHSLCKPRSRGG